MCFTFSQWPMSLCLFTAAYLISVSAVHFFYSRPTTYHKTINTDPTTLRQCIPCKHSVSTSSNSSSLSTPSVVRQLVKPSQRRLSVSHHLQSSLMLCERNLIVHLSDSLTPLDFELLETLNGGPLSTSTIILTPIALILSHTKYHQST